MAIIILKQIFTMLIYMLVGYCLYKTGKITDEGSKTLANMLPFAIIPATILNGFLMEFTPERLHSLGISFFFAVIVLFVACLIARLVFRESGIDCFSASFSNAAFIGIPLVRAALGEEGVFYLTALFVLLNILQWTYGLYLITDYDDPRGKDAAAEKSQKQTAAKRAGLFKKIFCNPLILSAIVGLILFVTGIGALVPSPVKNAIGGIASVNAPVAMITLGVYLAKIRIPELFTLRRLYLVSFVRLLVIPVVTILILSLIPAEPAIKMTMIIAASTPVGVNVALYAQIYEKDYVYACKTITQSTLFSVITLPVIILFAEMLIH